MTVEIRIDAKVMKPEGDYAKLSPTRRKKWWKVVGDVTIDALKTRLLGGIGANDRKLLPRLHPRADRANGAPLSPHYSQSRTIRLMRVKNDADAATIFWGEDWGRILAYHKAGIPSRKGLRKRNVIDLPPKQIVTIQTAARTKFANMPGTGPGSEASPGSRVRSRPVVPPPQRRLRPGEFEDTLNDILSGRPLAPPYVPPAAVKAKPVRSPKAKPVVAPEPPPEPAPAPEPTPKARASRKPIPPIVRTPDPVLLPEPEPAPKVTVVEPKAKPAKKWPRRAEGLKLPNDTTVYYEADAAQRVKDLFGKKAEFDPVLLTRLAGAQPGMQANVSASMNRFNPDINVLLTTPKGINISQTIKRDAIKFEDIFLPASERGKNTLAKIVYEQALAAHEVGIPVIKADAAKGNGNNGYYSLPRIGFDAETPYGKLSDLMSTPEGRAFWKENGNQLNVEFSTHPDSPSMRALRERLGIK